MFIVWSNIRVYANGLGGQVNPSPYNVRTTVHEYGGGAFAVHNDTVLFSNFADQRLYISRNGEEPTALTDEPYRYADGNFSPDGRFFYVVREDHTGEGEAENTIVRIDLENPSNGEIVASGHDFYSNPRVSPNGKQLVWNCWDHPNMPWDTTELYVLNLESDDAPQLVAGSNDESIFQPSWAPDGTLYFVSDISGWWNLYRLQDGDTEIVLDKDAEFGMPIWNLGFTTYCFLGDHQWVVHSCLHILQIVEHL